MAVVVTGCTSGAGALPWSSEPTPVVQVEPRESPLPAADSSVGVGLAPGNLDTVGSGGSDNPDQEAEPESRLTAQVGPRTFVDDRGRITATMVWYQRVLDRGVDLDAVAVVNITLVPIADPETGAASRPEEGSESEGSGPEGPATGYLVQGRVEFVAPDTVCRRVEASRDCQVTDLVDADLVGVASRRGNRLVIAVDWRRFGPEENPGLPLVGVVARGEQALTAGTATARTDAVGRALTDSGLVGEFDLSLTIPQARRFHSRTAGSGSGFMELVPVD